jgi:ABC-type siderophore export system fused ATPase/permease subunit
MTRTVKSDSEKLDDVIIETAKGQEFTVGEIKHSNRIQKSATPKQDLSWYIKWIASAFILASMSIRGIPELAMFDIILSIIGVTGWMWVGFLWKDRALILLNGVGIILFLRTLITGYLIV